MLSKHFIRVRIPKIKGYFKVVAILFVSFIGLVINGCTAHKDIIPETFELPSHIAASTNDSELKITRSLLQMVNDENAERLVKESLKNNYDIRVTALRLKSAGLLLSRTSSALTPNVDAGYSLTRSNQTFNRSTLDTHNISVSVSWELDLWGRLADQHNSEVYSFEAQELDYKRAQDSLAARVLQSYFKIKSQIIILDIHKKRVNIFTNLEETILKNFRAGIGSLDDFSFAKTRTEIALSRMSNARQEYDDFVRELEILLGRYPAATIDLSGGLPDIEAPAPIVPASILNNRLDIQSAIRKIRSAKSLASFAHKAKLPNIVLSANIFRDNKNFNKLGATKDSWSLVGNILYPIFNSGRIKDEAFAADAEAEAVYMDFVSVVIGAMKEVESTFSNEKYLMTQLAHLEKAVQYARISSDYYEKRYREGLDTVMSLLTAREQELSIQFDIVEIKAARIINRIDMALALGSGMEEKK